MKILRNYILKDFFSVFIFSTFILTTVFLMGSLIQISDWIVRKGLPVLDGLKLLSYGIPRLAGMIIPPAFLLGVLLSMGRLIADNEIIAIRVAGISHTKLLSIFLIVSIVFSLGLFILNDKVIPNLHYRYNEMKNVFTKNIPALIEPETFLEFENYILFASDKNDNKLKNIIIYELDEDKETSKTTNAKSGEFIVEGNILKIKLENGWRDETSPSNPNAMYRLNFKVFFMDIPIKQKARGKLNKKPKDMTIKEMRTKMNYLQSQGIDPRNEPIDLQKEFHKRISFSFSILVFALLGFSVSLIVKHRERTINFFIAFAGIFLYYMLFILGDTLIEKELILPVLGMWLPNIITTAIGGYLFLRYAHFR